MYTKIVIKFYFIKTISAHYYYEINRSYMKYFLYINDYFHCFNDTLYFRYESLRFTNIW